MPRCSGPEREVARHERARDAAPHGLAADQHLLERDLERIGVAPQIDADGIADRDEIDPGAVGDLRELIIPRDDADDFRPSRFICCSRGMVTGFRSSYEARSALWLPGRDSNPDPAVNSRLLYR